MLEIHSRFLTMKEIAPKWAERFEELPLPLTSAKRLSWSMRILFARTCVIGEAYGSDNYVEQCEKCRALGYGFVTAFITGSSANLKKNEHLFIEHWNQKHRQITEVQMLKRSKQSGCI